jgi:hypothetical protein
MRRHLPFQAPSLPSTSLFATRRRPTRTEKRCLTFAVSILLGDISMRKMCRVLADRTRSDERALKYGMVALAVSVSAVSLLTLLLA